MGYSPVYSFGMIYYCADEPATDWSVPPGYTGDVRQITLYQDSADAQLSLWVILAGEGPQFRVAYLSVTPAAPFAELQPRLVAPQNSLFFIEIDGAASDACAYVGGYVLKNVVD